MYVIFEEYDQKKTYDLVVARVDDLQEARKLALYHFNATKENIYTALASEYDAGNYNCIEKFEN